MSSSVPTDGHVEFAGGQASNLHIFENCGTVYAFNPANIRLVALRRSGGQGSGLNVDEYGSRVISRPPSSLLGELRKNGIFEKRHTEPSGGFDFAEIMVNATQECNLACNYCFVDRGRFGYGDGRARMLPPGKAERLIRALPVAIPSVKEFCIHFYGGEPLLNLPAMEAAVDASERTPGRFSFSVTTNGTICSSEAISLLRRGRFRVILSIDGPARIHDAERVTAAGGPTHSKVIEFLNRVKGEGLFVRGSSVIRSGWSLREATEYLKTLPVDAIKAQAVRLPERHRLALRGEEREAYVRDLWWIAQGVVESIRRGEYPKDDRFNQRVLQLVQGVRRRSFCGAGLNIFGVASDGTMLPCVLLAGAEGSSLGNIDDSPKWVEAGRKWVDSNKERCRGCWALPLCGGGCPAMRSVCGEDECDLVRANCEIALAIFGTFIDHPSDLLALAGVV